MYIWTNFDKNSQVFATPYVRLITSDTIFLGLNSCLQTFHCEPHEIYKKYGVNRLTEGYSFGGDDDKLRDRNMNGHKKTMFSMYVDTMPLKWNVHFIPQSFFCNGLYLTFFVPNKLSKIFLNGHCICISIVIAVATYVCGYKFKRIRDSK